MRKNCSSDRGKTYEGQEFSKFLRSLEQFVQTLKGQNNFWQQNAFCFSYLKIRTIIFQIGKMIGI